MSSTFNDIPASLLDMRQMSKWQMKEMIEQLIELTRTDTVKWIFFRDDDKVTRTTCEIRKPNGKPLNLYLRRYAGWFSMYWELECNECLLFKGSDSELDRLMMAIRLQFSRDFINMLKAMQVIPSKKPCGCEDECEKCCTI